MTVWALTPRVAVAELQAATQPAKRPNIVMFIADDMSLKDLSLYNSGPNARGTTIPSPNVTELAKEGMVFDLAYATSPACAPSRAALLTGVYNLRNGVMFNQVRAKKEIKKWPAYFQELGYEVVAIGKVSHYGHVQAYGFDYAAHWNYHEDICIDEAVKWLANRQSGPGAASQKPLCLMVGTNFPHVPWPEQGIQTPQEMILPAKIADTERTREMRTKYSAAVKRADSDLGEVREAVKKYLPSDTLFVMSADQGSQWPFGKWNLYDAGTHIPLIVKWEGHIQPGVRTEAMVSWVDVMPTLLEAAGGEAPTDIDGKSFLPVLEGKTAAARDRIYTTHSGDAGINYYPTRAVRLGNWAYIRNLDPKLVWHSHVDVKQADTGYFGSWLEAAKTNPVIADLVDRYYHRPPEELYDMTADPEQWKNLASDPSHKTELDKCRAALDEWMHASGDKGLETDAPIRPRPAPIMREKGLLNDVGGDPGPRAGRAGGDGGGGDGAEKDR